ncbi:NAD-glutamate dehydrogenase [Anaplasmataceae bacterium AB001_6]|nr:NAD-glutamate dehydrogenase [Anaplasmataceae bacterium AB001_6]
MLDRTKFNSEVFLESLLEKLKYKRPKEDHDNLTTFIIDLYHNMRVKFSSDFFLLNSSPENIEALICFFDDMFSFINSYKGKDLKDLITNFNYELNIENSFYGTRKKYSLIAILNEDSPFIVDSLTNCIVEEGGIIHQRANLVLGIQRDNNEDIIKINKATECSHKNENNYESLVLFITNHVKEDKQSNLRSLFKDMVHDIQHIVNDWKPMLECMDEIKDNLSKNSQSENDCEVKEVIEFCTWLRHNSFVFFGISRYKKNSIEKPDLSLGLSKAKNFDSDCTRLKEIDSLCNISRSTISNIIHRCVNLDLIRFETPVGNDSSDRYVYFVFGLFSRVIDFQDLTVTPIVREKVKNIIEKASFSKNGHTSKSIIDTLRSMPRNELLTTTEEELQSIAIGLLSISGDVHFKLFIFDAGAGKYVKILLYISNKNFTMPMVSAVQNAVNEVFDGDVQERDILFKDDNFIRMKLGIEVEVFPTEEQKMILEEKLNTIIEDWGESLLNKITDFYGYEDGYSLYKQYGSIFSARYQKTFNADSAVRDIKAIDGLVKENKLRSADLYDVGHSQYNIKIYSMQEDMLSLSYLIPVIENMGFKAIDNTTFKLSIDKDRVVWIQHFVVTIEGVSMLQLSQIRPKAEEIIRMVLSKDIENDYYNSLTITAGLNWREIMLMRVIGSYLKQIKFSYSVEYIQKSFVKNPEAVNFLIELFNAKFKPSKEFEDIVNTEREDNIKLLNRRVNKIIDSITNVVDDKIFRAFLEVIGCIIRTNFFLNKDYISFKIDSQKSTLIPSPKPFVEIYVYSKQFEGIHLRGGKVARGGLRWSDRTEDFRTEVMGLWRAQMPKNVTIVPVGSKGGFVVKGISNESKDFFDFGVLCYKKFLSGMLDITDNVIDGKIIKPQNVLCYDDDDTYLVVAADKGTATFSNYANEISQKYNFWLGDAFASGGSSGYDHKKMGITTRGAWNSVVFHFWFMSKNISKEYFTVVGIGDLAGDVFGNAMIISDKIKLIAAFNHMHIFVDPNPDPVSSFIERKRIFNLPRSQWDDYNQELISKGGGIFSRSSKNISVTSEMKEVFDITEDLVTPNALIRYILKSQVDLIWNGGIGTFVKSSSEVNEMIGDKNNDAIRVNGIDIRAKVIGEGGNLGCTQLGRIEYANNGGLINTDFIDNSCGVCCSDYEVNIKIAFAELLTKGKLTLEERNVILSEMEDEVARKILTIISKPQALILIRENMNRSSLEQYQGILKKLETISTFNRSAEYLPDNKEMTRMIAEGRHFSVPRLAVLMAYTKMFLYEKLLNSQLIQNDYMLRYLNTYFPSRMRNDFAKEIENHQLRKEIIATFIINFMVNRVGITFINNIVEDYGVTEEMVFSILIVLSESYGITGMWVKKVEPLINSMPKDIYYEIECETMDFATNTVTYFLNNYGHSFDIESVITELSPKIDELRDKLEITLDDHSLNIYKNMYNRFVQMGIDDAVAKQIASFKFMDSALPIIQIVQDLSNVSFANSSKMIFISKLYYHIGDIMKFNHLRKILLSEDKTNSYWHRVATRLLKNDIYEIQKCVTLDIIHSIDDDKIDFKDATLYFEKWKEKKGNFITDYEDFINKLIVEKFSINKFVVIIKRLEYMLKK